MFFFTFWPSYADGFHANAMLRPLCWMWRFAPRGDSARIATQTNRNPFGS